MELGHEPRNVKVIVKEYEQIFLVYDEGIIAFTEHVSNDTMTILQEHEHVRKIEEHVSIVQDHVNNDDALSLSHRDGALCEARRQNESLTLRWYSLICGLDWTSGPIL